MTLWIKRLRQAWFQADRRKSPPQARRLPQLEQLESRETPNSLFNPLFSSAL